MELKTQKEIIEELKQLANEKDIVIDAYRFKERERQEAIKHIKDLGDTKGKFVIANEIQAVVQWIAEFFDITNEDLK